MVVMSQIGMPGYPDPAAMLLMLFVALPLWGLSVLAAIGGLVAAYWKGGAYAYPWAVAAVWIGMVPIAAFIVAAVFSGRPFDVVSKAFFPPLLSIGWLLILPTVVGGVLWRNTQRLREVSGLCPECRYDLRGSRQNPSCPECGAPIDYPKHQTSDPPANSS